MADPAKKLEEEEEEQLVTDRVSEARVVLNRSVETLSRKARRLELLADPLRKECSETAELANQCEEAVGDI